MRIFNININSSVVTFNVIAIIGAIVAYLVDWVTGNQETLSTVFTPEQISIGLAIFSAINIFLRTQNVTGRPPIEVKPKPEKRSK